LSLPVAKNAMLLLPAVAAIFFLGLPDANVRHSSMVGHVVKRMTFYRIG
jgi:hypothetical protein